MGQVLVCTGSQYYKINNHWKTHNARQWYVTKWEEIKVLKPFQSRASPKFWRRVCKAITYQPIELESCSNHLRIQHVCYLKLKKKFSFWVCGSLGEDVTSDGVIFILLAYFRPSWRGPGRQSNEPIVSLKFLLKTRLSYESLEPLIDFLAYLDQKLHHKKTKSGQNFYPYKRKPVAELAVYCNLLRLLCHLRLMNNFTETRRKFVWIYFVMRAVVT